ncbi:translation initiation factor IF-2-like [Amphibalanus amphitrite]|uniref:translation initiation factor IF-2-like n=1 Tax=Amphibalanus amphitrite TaxID=1232801 RepID=UPI001C902C35|nr:translation initiation factor IF-2-like [Amphibalanus amphitrite]
MLVNNPHSIESAWTLPVSGLAAPAAPAAGPRPQLVRVSDLRALLDGAPLGRFDMRPDTEAVFDALCDRERGRPEKVLMKEWTPRPAGGQLHIDGWRWTRGVRSFVSSAPICHWFSEREVEATDGQVYVLEGRLSVALAEKYALPVLARLTFATGFPSQWQLLAKELHLLTVGQEAVRRQPDLVSQHTDSPGRTAGKPPQQPDSDSGSGSELPQPQSAPVSRAVRSQPEPGSKAARSQPEPSSKAAPAKRQTRKRAAPGSSQPVPTAAGGAAQPEPPGTPPLPEEPSAAPANARGRATSRGRWTAQPAPSSPPESKSSSPAASERSSLDDTMAPLTRAMSETMYDRLKKDTRRRSPRVFLHRLAEEPRKAPTGRAAAGRRGHEFRPSARPGTQRYRLEQMAFLTAQNDAAQPDDLFGGGLLDSGAGGGGGGGGLLGLADGELMAAVTPLAPGRGGGRRPAAHSSLTPVAALAAGGAYSVKTPTMATSTISPGNPLNSIHRDEAARYMVNRKKQAGPARQRLRMGTDRPAAPSFSGSSDIGSAARLIEEDAAWLLREDDPSDEPADEYFDYDG